MAAKGHALCSPSAAHRWMACTPSARLESTFPYTTSEAAEEGTLAHAIIELFLKRIIEGKPMGKVTKRLSDHPLFFPSMVNYCTDYIDEVMRIFNEEKHAGHEPVMYSEQKVDFTQWVPNGFGTTDTVIIADGHLYVIDFKFGKGVPVSALNNPQLRIYALGTYAAYDILYDIDTVTTMIIQPRSPEETVTSETLSAEDLLWWGDNVLRQKAAMATAGEGEFVEGEHCRFCRAKDVCLARTQEMIESAKESTRDPKTLTNDEIARLYPFAKKVESWAKELLAYMNSKAVEGEEFPGFKLVPGRSVRTIQDEIAAAKVLTGAGYTDIYDLKGIGKLEEMVGKKQFADLLGDLIVKPEGKPTLVPDSDPREAINTKNPFDDGFDDSKIGG